MLSDRQSSTFWASGSVLAGAEARGTRPVPSGCSVAGLARRTCDTRAWPRGRARRGFSPNVSDRLLGSSGPALVAGRSRVDGGRSLLLRGAARAAHGPGEGRRVGQIRRPNHSRSQRVAIQMMPLLRRWQPPCARYAQSQRSCTRGRACGGRRARLNLMPPCRLGNQRNQMWLGCLRSPIEWRGSDSRKSMVKRALAVVMGTFGKLYLGAMATDLQNSCCI